MGCILFEDGWDQIKEDQTEHQSGGKSQDDVGAIAHFDREKAAQRSRDRGDGREHQRFMHVWSLLHHSPGSSKGKGEGLNAIVLEGEFQGAIWICSAAIEDVVQAIWIDRDNSINDITSRQRTH